MVRTHARLEAPRASARLQKFFTSIHIREADFRLRWNYGPALRAFTIWTPELTVDRGLPRFVFGLSEKRP